MSSTYNLYGGELSYFTRKLEAALIFYGLDFENQDKNTNDPSVIESRSGTHDRNAQRYGDSTRRGCTILCSTSDKAFLSTVPPLHRSRSGRTSLRSVLLSPGGPPDYLLPPL